MRVALLFVFFVSLSFAASGQLDDKGDDIHLKVTKLLLKKDLRALVNEMAAVKATDVESQLMRLDVFWRAGEKLRVYQTLVRLSEAADMPKEETGRKWILDFVRYRIAHDLTANRIYYEKLTADDGYYSTNPFIQLWQSQGEEKELEEWLSRKAQIGSSWFMIDLERRLKRDDAQSILDRLADRVRNNPRDVNMMAEYLGMVSHAQQYTRLSHPGRYDNETDWLGDILKAQGAVDAYEIGTKFLTVNPWLAIKYYEQSLGMPVTAADVTGLEEKYRIHSSSGGPTPRINWETQLRYSTKEKLADVYQRTGQATLAQPLVEELITAKKDDVYKQNLYALAGAVQAGSGARVVESKVVQDGAEKFESVEYWFERIRYYQGRNEGEQIVRSFIDGLARVPAASRARFVSGFKSIYRHTLLEEPNKEQRRSKLSETLLNELNEAKPDSDLAYEIARASTDSGLGLREVMDAAFVRRHDLFIPLIENRDLSDPDVGDLVEDVLDHKKLTPAGKSFYLDELERKVKNAPAERRLAMARLFKDVEEYGRMVPLILYYLKDTARTTKNESERASATGDLFEAYNISGKWQLAEKLMNDNQSTFLGGWGWYLQRLAIAAGQANAPQDAFRIWMKAVNFNGHSDFGLINLVDTSTRPLLVDYYKKMKLDEPNSAAADKALKILMRGRN